MDCQLTYLNNHPRQGVTAQHAQQAMLSLEQKVHVLEVEKTVAVRAEQRLSDSISQVQSN